jgi:hypothetical protein
MAGPLTSVNRSDALPRMTGGTGQWIGVSVTTEHGFISPEWLEFGFLQP